MRRPRIIPVATAIGAVLLLPPGSQAINAVPWFLADICGHLSYRTLLQTAAASTPVTPPLPCGPAPTSYHRIQQATASGDLSIDLAVGSDTSTSMLCYVYNGVPEAPVIRVQRGNRLTIRHTNTMQNTGPNNTQNCLLQTFINDGACAEPEQGFQSAPGPDDGFYPIQANVPHLADGSTNLHVHGFVVSPLPCHDEVILSTLYAANWGAPVGRLFSCQAAPDELTYTYDIPADHPEGLYWYHTHRHGETEASTMLGLVGAIVIEGPDDARRAAMGVGDDVLVIHDLPYMGPTGTSPPAQVMAQHRAESNPGAGQGPPGPGADPRIDVANEIGCAPGAPDTGGAEVTHLTLNGAAVPELADGTLPADDVVLTKTMQPNQTEIWRILNASADTAISPTLSQVQNGVTTVLPLAVLARDGVPVADDAGYPSMQTIDTTSHPVMLSPANRLEILVHAPPPGATLYLDSSQIQTGCAAFSAPTRRLLRVVSAGQPVAPVADSALAPTDPDAYYTNILNQTPSVQRVFAFTEYLRGFTTAHSTWVGPAPAPEDVNTALPDFFLTQIAYSADPSLQPVIKPFDMSTLTPDVVVHLNGAASVTEQWVIQNYTLENHAFHIHQIHFRDISAGRDPQDAPLLDTVNVPFAANMNGVPAAPGQSTLLMTFTQAQIGEFVFHCHILGHEDLGMMQKIRVVAD
ncbi:MAG TPA: multicopper oxidase domain-containing protein [Rhodopila sp.]|nr:multicopper oxidase domain-containing protein [Rhodopila sp.]